MTNPPAGQRPSDHVSQEFVRLRKERRMSLAEISEKLKELGQPIPVLGLRTIEQGTRRIEVNEVIALAQVFGVPPVVLMFPIGRAGETELLPGQALTTWHALKWFTGRATLGDEPTSREAAIIGLFEKHDMLAFEAEDAKAGLQLWPPGSEDAKSHDDERRWRIALRDLRMVRAQMRQFKLDPPELDPFIAEVDDTTYRFLTRTELASHFPNTNYPPGLVVEQYENGNVWPVDFAEKLEDPGGRGK